MKVSVFFALFFLCCTSWLSAQTDVIDFDEAYLVNHLSPTHPRLVLTLATETKLRERIRTDTVARAYYANLREEAYHLLDTTLIWYDIEGFRLLFVAREMGRRMSLLSMAYRMEKDPVLLDRIDKELLAVCAFPDWNPDHFLDIAEMSVGVATALDWTGEDLPKETVARAKRALIDKALKPSYDLTNERMGWIDGTNNWNTVCHGGLVLAALAVAEEEPALAARTIRRALEKMPNSLNEYGPDGNYPEGPGYWGFGTIFGVLASDALTTALGTDFGLSATPGFMESADFVLLATAPSGRYYNFSDSGDDPGSRGAVALAWFAAQTGDGQYFRRKLLMDADVTKGRYGGQGLAWLGRFEEKKQGTQPLIWRGRGSTPVVVMRGESSDPRGFYLGAKGGRGQISHGNLDAGSFIFELDGVRWAIDPGNQRYYLLNKIGFQLGRYCQDCERWSLLTKSNLTHGTLSVNDERFDVTGFVPITNFAAGDQPTASFDLSALYPGTLDSVTRTFTKEDERSLLVTDEFTTTDSTRFVTWSVMTIAEVVPHPGGARLRQDGKELVLSVLEPAGISVSIISLDPPPLIIDKVIPGLKRIEVRVPAYTLTSGKGRISVRLSGTDKTN